MQTHALFADPNNPHDIALKMQALLTLQPAIDANFLAQFDWKKTAQTLMQLYL
jgi:hypothetical protein